MTKIMRKTLKPGSPIECRPIKIVEKKCSLPRPGGRFRGGSRQSGGKANDNVNNLLARFIELIRKASVIITMLDEFCHPVL